MYFRVYDNSVIINDASMSETVLSQTSLQSLITTLRMLPPFLSTHKTHVL